MALKNGHSWKDKHEIDNKNLNIDASKINESLEKIPHDQLVKLAYENSD